VAATVFNFKDFRGGFFDTAYPNELMKDNECYQLENVWWSGGLKKRGGVQKAVTFTGALRGGVRHKIGATWYTFVAVQGNGSTHVYFNKTGATDYSTITKLDDAGSVTTLAFTADASFSFARMGEQIVAVNGVDKEHLLFPTVSTVYGQTLEKYDTRTRSDHNWFAGNLESATGVYVNDTIDAQDIGSTDFLLATAVHSGMWAACDVTFNKFVIKDSESNANASFGFQYYGKADATSSVTWVTVTPKSVPTWTSVGDKAVEFEFPIDANTREVLMRKMDDDDSPLDQLTGRFCARMTVSNMTAGTIEAQGLDIQHTEYLSQLNVNYKAKTVASHKRHVFLGFDQFIQVSPLISPAGGIALGVQNTVKGWESRGVFPIEDGGKIQSLVPQLDYLTVLTEGQMMAIRGNSFDSWSLRQLSPDLIGPINQRSATIVKGRLYFVARDGIYMFDGTNLAKVSSHIETLINSLTLTDAIGAEYLGRLWMSFPSNSVTLVADPDSLRQDEDGDYRLSFYKHTGYRGDTFIYNNGDGDDGKMNVLDNSKKFLSQMNTGEKDIATTSVTITAKFQSRYHDFGNQLTDKTYEMFKPLVGDVSQAQGVNYTLKFYTRSRYGFASSSAVLTASVASGIHTEDLTLPPEQDGKNLGVYLEHDYKTEAKFIGYSVAVEEKPF
jgi:hypothetical protein